jgi:hypothetical protein
MNFKVLWVKFIWWLWTQVSARGISSGDAQRLMAGVNKKQALIAEVERRIKDDAKLGLSWCWFNDFSEEEWAIIDAEFGRRGFTCEVINNRKQLRWL